MAKKIMTVEEMQDRENWLKVRNMGIGGSDAATVLGLNRWKSPYQLWLEKTGQVEAEDISDKECVHWGNVLEDVVAREFTRLTGKKVSRCGTLQDDEYDFLLANVDRMVAGENAGLECKTANGWAAKMWEGDEVPDSYYLQCQHYMMVTGCERWYIACLIGGNHFVWKEIPRNESDIEALREAEVHFWHEYVQKGIMPPVDGSDGCSNALSDKYKGGMTGETDIPQDHHINISIILNLKAEIEEKKEELARYENQLKEDMGDYELAYVGEHKITWKTMAGRVSIDSKKLKAEKPEIFEQYAKVGKSFRTFKIS